MVEWSDDLVLLVPSGWLLAMLCIILRQIGLNTLYSMQPSCNQNKNQSDHISQVTNQISALSDIHSVELFNNSPRRIHNTSVLSCCKDFLSVSGVVFVIVEKGPQPLTCQSPES